MHLREEPLPYERAQLAGAALVVPYGAQWRCCGAIDIVARAGNDSGRRILARADNAEDVIAGTELDDHRLATFEEDATHLITFSFGKQLFQHGCLLTILYCSMLLLQN